MTSYALEKMKELIERLEEDEKRHELEDAEEADFWKWSFQIDSYGRDSYPPLSKKDVPVASLALFDTEGQEVSIELMRKQVKHLFRRLKFKEKEGVHHFCRPSVRTR